ncbi:MAG TPA: hypothetical protein VMN60_04295 [Longimicrobiales bacterium]|nr:hypothetical protein [Longimicrobiales bacterium]
MYTQVRLFIKTGIAFLIVGLGLGSVLMVRRELFGIWPDRRPVSAHTHALTVGFLMFLILGVALWLFPRAPKDDRRYSPGRIRACYWILVIGTAARVLAETVRATVESSAVSWIVVIASIGQAAGLLLYFWTMWSRIRPVGSHLREARGEEF